MQVLLPADHIQKRVGELARQIADDYNGQPVTIVGVLTGCLMFLADLVRQLDLPLRIDFIQASSYRGPTTTADLPASVRNSMSVHDSPRFQLTPSALRTASLPAQRAAKCSVARRRS